MRKKKPNYIKGAFVHRRTETDYMAALLETVTLDDWREIVGTTVENAKQGDSSARAFLAQYLVGKTGLTAPPPLTVVVQQLSGRDPVVDELVSQNVNRIQFPNPFEDSALESTVRETIREELRLRDQDAGSRSAEAELSSSADDFGKI